MTNNKQQISYKKDCHTGNTKIYTEPNGGTLFIGGWNQQATFDWNTHVIDLTGTEHKWWDIPVAFDEDSKKFLPFLMRAYAGWLSLPFPDYGTPKGMSIKSQWVGMATTIQSILKEGKDVLVACHGGHGRSGLFCSIVGHLLHGNSDGWNSPVEKVRSIHCKDAVETLAQEKYVYDILGLKINITRTYGDNDPYFGYDKQGKTKWSEFTTSTNFKACPICGTESLYTETKGMCLTCSNEYKKDAPVVEYLSLDDIKNRGNVEHACTNESCMGIWTAALCGHTTHDQIIYEGLCQDCYQRAEEEAKYAEAHDSEFGTCPLCGKDSTHAKRYGICGTCGDGLIAAELADHVHNTITDPYRAIAHTCDSDTLCVGIVIGDVCGHVVHNQEVEDGLCVCCFEKRQQEVE